VAAVLLRVASARRENAVVRVVSKQEVVSTPTKESTVEKEVYDCVVVGAGISGLCTAQAFATRHDNGSGRWISVGGGSQQLPT
jgi:ribulose 1,5-bisphosphate synthetase/thiazole synthase